MRKLYELYGAYPVNGGTSWIAGLGAVFDLSSDAMRPAGWTSADAAGLSILPGLVRYDEVVQRGSTAESDHACAALHVSSYTTWVCVASAALREFEYRS